MTLFCMVRHGQTDWNLEGRYQGQSDVPLNSTGLVQAGNLARALQKEHFDAVYSSDLTRARETAQAIVSVNGNLPIHFDPRLREINQGQWEGVQVEEIQKKYASLWQAHIDDPVQVRPPGGENVAEVFQRVKAVMDEISKNFPTGKVLVVSHGLVIATILCTVNGIPLGQAYHYIPENSVPIWLTWPSVD